MKRFFFVAVLLSVYGFSVRYAYDTWTFWRGFEGENCPFTVWIEKHVPSAKRVQIDEKPDVVICGIHGRNKWMKAIDMYRKMSTVQRVICFSQESRAVKNNGKFDHFFSFVREFSDKNTYLPNWLYRTYDWSHKGNDIYLNLLLHNKRVENHGREKFCAFLHKSTARFRDRFVDVIGKKYKRIDSGGGHRNTIGRQIEKGIEKKVEFFRDYKFCMSMENNRVKDYCTEKLVDGLISGAIPIYYGDPDVSKDFNPKLYLNVKSLGDFDRAISLIKRLDRNPAEYSRYFDAPVTSQFIRDLLTTKKEQYEKWVVSKILGVDLGAQKPEYKAGRWH